jgi:hypothetical protein
MGLDKQAMVENGAEVDNHTMMGLASLRIGKGHVFVEGW